MDKALKQLFARFNELETELDDLSQTTPHFDDDTPLLARCDSDTPYDLCDILGDISLAAKELAMLCFTSKAQILKDLNPMSRFQQKQPRVTSTTLSTAFLLL